MTLFRYQGRYADGRRAEGDVHAPNLGSAAERLREQQVIPVEITPLPEAAASVLPWGRGDPGLDGLILFAHQMHTLVRGGVPLLGGLRGVAEGTHHAGMRQALMHISHDIQAGHGLATALGRYPHLFDGVFVRMVALGEASGTLEAVFASLARYLEAEKETRHRIREAVRYPFYVLVTVAVAVAVVHGFVLPAFTGLFQRLGGELPWATRVLLESSGFLSNHGGKLLLAMGGMIPLGMVALRQPVIRRGWACILLRLPLLGTILHQGALARFARGFAMASGAGLTVAPTLTIVSGVVGNACLEEAVGRMRHGIERGGSLLMSARASGIFPPMVLQMMAVGEEGGAMSEVMQRVAEHYDREVAHRVRALGAAMEPLILTLVAGVVLVLAMGVFLPMWELGRTALHP